MGDSLLCHDPFLLTAGWPLWLVCTLGTPIVPGSPCKFDWQPNRHVTERRAGTEFVVFAWDNPHGPPFDYQVGIINRSCSGLLAPAWTFRARAYLPARPGPLCRTPLPMALLRFDPAAV